MKRLIVSPSPRRTARPALLAVVLLALAGVGASCASSTSDPVGSPGDASITDGARDTSTTSDATSGGDGGGVDAKKDTSSCKLTKPYSSKDTDCNACAERECCEPVNDCYATSDCDDGYVNCIIACVLLPDDAGPDAADAGPQSCLAQCASQYPTGKTQYDALTSCVSSACAAECN